MKISKPITKPTAPKKGETDLADLIDMMNKVSGPKSFKLQQNGPTRIRIIKPQNSKRPIQPAYEHWVPTIDDKGEARKKLIVCPKSMGRLEPCPICTLNSFLLNSTVPEIKDLGTQMRQNGRFLVYAIDRTYMIQMANLRQKIVAIPDQEKIYDIRLPKTVMDKIMENINDSLWGDCFSPTNGYDWKIVGSKKGNAMFVSYEVTPIPREFSPDYDPTLAAGLKPLEAMAVVSPMEDIEELIQAQLQFAVEVGGEEGSELVDAFLQAWKEETESQGSIEVEDSDSEEDSEEEESETEDEGGEEEDGNDNEGSDGEDETEDEEETEGDEGGIEGDDDGPSEEEEEPTPSPKKSKPAAGVTTRKTPAESTAAKGEAAKEKGSGMPQGFAAKLNSLRKQGKK